MKNQNIITILFLAVLSVSVSFAQQVVSTKGDKINVADLKIEPWNVENTADKATLNTQSVYQNANVGIGNFATTTPSEKLQVEGSLKTQKAFLTEMGSVDNAVAAASPSTYASMGVNLSTGELVKMITSTGNSKVFSYLTFKITTKTGEDYVKSFDTKIPSSEYTLILVNAIFQGGALALYDISGTKYYAPFQFAAQKGGSGTWILTADYNPVGPVDKTKKYNWDLICLVIQNSSIQDLGKFTRDLNGSHEGGMDNKSTLGL